MAQCPICKKEIPENSEFCPTCGNKIEKKVQRRKYKVIPMIVLVIAISLILWFILQNVFLKVSIMQTEVEAGSNIVITDIVKPSAGNAKIINAETIETNSIGKKDVEYELQVFGFKKKKACEINVVDTTAPVINGAENIKIIGNNKEIIWSDYYTVDDFEKGLDNNITCAEKINTGKEGKTKVTISVKDSSGNEGTKEISVEIIVPSALEKIAIKLLEYCEKNEGIKITNVKNVSLWQSAGSIYFAQIDGNYYFYDSGKNSAMDLEVATYINYGSTSYYPIVKMMFTSLATKMDMSRLKNFMQ